MKIVTPRHEVLVALLVIGRSFPAVSTFVYTELFPSLAKHFSNTGIKVSNVNVNYQYLKIPQEHRGPHKTPSCSRPWVTWML